MFLLPFRFKYRKKYLKIALWAFFIFLVLYIEAASYFLQKSRWPSPTCGVQPSYYHKVLLVADPQILGEVTESWIARWDCDRFLSRTFKLAVEHVSPSLVIFLGDLMDEGSTASASEYSRYYQRFTKIFRTDSLLVNKTIFLPGDNDIGGENEEITPQKLNRFNEYFGLKPEVVSFHNVRFSKVNFMLKTSPIRNVPMDDQKLDIVISHMPLLGASSFFTEDIIQKLKPSLIISAHDHKAVHFVGSLETGERTHIESMVTNQVMRDSKWRFQTSKIHTNEVLVPTCSYRMGVQESGYGVLLIDSEGDNVCYSVLWLPDRLFHIKIHFYLILPSLVVYLFIQIFKKYSSSCSL